MNDQQNPQYSIILPIFNEEACLQEVLQRIETVLMGLQESYEIICVDDCSKDSTWFIIEQFCRRNPSFKGIRFRRNFGHQLAIYAGVKYSSGNYVAIMDADGQDPPEQLPQAFQKCKEGYDVVYAIRKKRKEGIFRRASYFLFYRMYQTLVPFEVPLDSGDFSVFSKDVADFIKSRNEKTPFIRGLRSWYGGKQCGFEYERQHRLAGEPKYNYTKLFLLALNASISFSKTPLRLISMIGMTIACLAIFGGILIALMKLTIGIHQIGWASVVVLISFFGGLNLLVLGVVGEYIGNIFDEVKNRPLFLAAQSIGFKKPLQD